MDLEQRVEAWFTRLLAHVHAELAAGSRRSVEATAGPLQITHTFERGSSHENLTDALAAGARIPDGRVTVHSLEAPSADLILPSPLHEDDLGDRLGIRALEPTRWRLTWDAYSGVIRCFDRDSGVGLFVTAARPEDWEFGAPFRAFVHWAAAERGATMVHAATVVGAGGAALVVGPGGTGKSTTTLVGLGAGLSTVGDDYVWLEPTAGGFVVRSVYSTVKTKDGGPDAVPDVERTLVVEDGAKTIHFLGDPARRRLVREAPLAAIALLREDDSSPARASEALAATLPSTALQLPYEEGNTTAVVKTACASSEIVPLLRDGDLERLGRELRATLGGPVPAVSRPAVTVVLPVYNGADHIERALDSVFAQQGWEIHAVAVDDGSSDRSLEVLHGYAANEPRLTVVPSPQNRGVAAARNTAVELRRDPLIAFIDQDDRWTPDRLDRGWAALEASPDLGYVLAHQEFDRPDGPVPEWVRERWLDGPQTGFVPGTLLVWRSTWEDVGELDESLRAGTDDADWFARARDAGIPSRMLDDVVLRRTLHDKNASKNPNNVGELTALLRRSLARRDQDKDPAE